MKLVKVLAVVLVITISLLQLGTAKADSVKIHGHVRDSGGKPAGNVFIFCTSFDPPSVVYGSTKTDDQGYYSLSMDRPERMDAAIPGDRGRPIYEGFRMFVAWPAPERSVKWLPILSSINIEGMNIIEQDFTVGPAGTLSVKAYDTEGAHITSFDWWTTTPVYTTDLNWTITPSIFVYDQAIFALTINTPHIINFPWDVQGFGKVILRADNDGKGFNIRRQGETITINLNYELAKTESRLLAESYERYVREGYNFSNNLPSQIQSAHALLENTTHTPTDSGKARLADLCLNRTLWAAEQLESEKATQDIERYRKGNATIRFVDENDKPVADADVTITQSSHDFLFGAEPMGETPEMTLRAFKVLKQAGINFAHFDFCWWNTERPIGVYHFEENPPSLLESLKGMGFRLGAECLVLLEANPQTYDTGLVNLNYEQLKTKIHEHVDRLVNEYSQYIDYWIIAGNLHTGFDTLGYTQQQVIDLLQIGMQAARTADPDSHVLPVHLDGIGGEDDVVYVDDIGAYAFLSKLHELGLDNDGIELGLEYNTLYDFHSGFTGGAYTSNQISLPFRDLASISRMLDWYGTLSVPIHVVFDVPSHYESPLGYWHRRAWDEQLQAEWVETLYTIAFSKPLMREMNYVAALDDVDLEARRGILSADYSPKESFHALERLIMDKWTTRLDTKTDANGEAKFRGFAGNYTITIRTENGLINSTIHVNEQATRAYTIRTSQSPRINLSKTRAEQAIKNAAEGVNQAKTEGRTIFLDKAEDLLRDSQRALEEENYDQAILLAEEASQAADIAVSWLVIPVVTVFAAVVVSVLVLLRKRTKTSRTYATADPTCLPSG